MSDVIIDIRYNVTIDCDPEPEVVEQRIRLVGFQQIPGHITFVMLDESLDDFVVKLRRLGANVEVNFNKQQ